MKKVICFLFALAIFLTACSSTPTPSTTVSADTSVATEAASNSEYLPEDLLGKSPSELVALFGPDYEEVVPEGDPPYFHFYQRSPYQFCGSMDDPQISYIKGNQADSGILPGLCIGSTLTDLENWSSENQELEYTPADTWYESPNGECGWAFLMGNGYHYTFYIENQIIVSFECWKDVSQ